jgi:hypothetical protein
MDDMQKRVLVRLSDGPFTVDQVNSALARGMVDKNRYFSPGADIVTQTLGELETAGMTRSDSHDAWELTEAGWQEFDKLARTFRRSSGYSPVCGF